LVSAHRQGAESIPRAGIAVRLKLAMNCWSDTMMGKSLKKTETEGEREKEKERDREVGSSTGKSAFS
jgi:hypothetical protein